MDPIAIIGIGCRFPQAEGPRQFWRLLRDGVDAVSEVPVDRWNADALYDAAPQTTGKMNSRYGGFLSGVDQFDAAFFGISPREAVRMDPQQRLALEVAAQSLEDAGIPAPTLAGTAVGVFMGFGVPEYFIDQVSDLDRVNEYTNSGNTLSMIANRISYVFDFRGPSLVLDTACSSSLVSVLLACQSLQRGESSLALAGGVNLLLTPAISVGFSQLRALSPDGRCRSFDARANGYVRGEGIGILTLKRLPEALADGDDIYAVIRGGAMNQDGRSNGITAPNRFAQEAVLRAAYKNAAVSPGELQYVETHGSGTLLGDPIEAAALGTVLTEGRNGQRCAIGSVKTNIGHSEAAAGVAGLIKTALALKHGQIPPSLHFRSPNPHIDFERLPLDVQTELAPWPATHGTKLAGVSSFGYGGANAHLVLEEAPARAETAVPAENRPPKKIAISAWLSRADSAAPEAAINCSLPIGSRLNLLTVSGRSPEALAENAKAMREFLAGDGAETPLAEVCRAAATCRTHHESRLSVLAASKPQAIAALDDFLAGKTNENIVTGRRPAGGSPKIAFRYRGTNAQVSGLGREMYANQPLFRAAIDECATLLPGEQQYILRSYVVRSLCERHCDSPVLGQALPALFAVEYAATRLLESLGIRPDAVVGHWLGDGVAACVAGDMTVAAALERIASFAAVMGDVTDKARESQDLAELPSQGFRLLVEIGPSPADETAPSELQALSLLGRNGGCPHSLMRTLAALYAHGVEIDWRTFYGSALTGRIKLPTYRFQRKRYWLENVERESTQTSESNPSRGRKTEDESPRNTATSCDYPRVTQLLCALPTFQTQISASNGNWLPEHRVLGKPVLPATAIFDLALTAANELPGNDGCILKEVALEQMLALGDKPRTVQLALLPDGESHAFQMFSQSEGQTAWTRHATGRVAFAKGSCESNSPPLDVEAIYARLSAGPSPAAFYDALAERGLDYGPAFRGVRQLWRRDGEALGWIEADPTTRLEDHRVHPALLDAALHTIAAALPGDAQDDAAYVPAKLDRLQIHAPTWRGGWSHAQLRPAAESDAHTLIADVRMYDAEDRLAVEVIGLRFEKLPGRERVTEAAAPARTTEPTVSPTDLDNETLHALGAVERQVRLLAYLQYKLAGALEMDAAELDVEAPLHQLGLDSLVIFKLAAQIERELHVEVPLMELAVGPSVTEFTTLLLQQIEEC